MDRRNNTTITVIYFFTTTLILRIYGWIQTAFGMTQCSFSNHRSMSASKKKVMRCNLLDPISIPFPSISCSKSFNFSACFPQSSKKLANPIQVWAMVVQFPHDSATDVYYNLFISILFCCCCCCGCRCNCGCSFFLLLLLFRCCS